VSTVYGTCDASEGGCRPPLDIQNAAECARNPNSYKPNPGVPPEPEEPLFFGEHVRMRSAPWIPDLLFEERTRIELFAGDTTVVVFATDARLARRAGEALAKAIARYAPRSAAARLRADANEPGDGSACRSFRGRV
jgi:hypothetical protein